MADVNRNAALCSYSLIMPYNFIYLLRRQNFIRMLHKELKNLKFDRRKINNITGSATGGDASEIVLNLSVAAWGTENHTPSFS